MALYLDKITENEEKIAKLEDTIRRSTAKKKKLIDENVHLTYMSLCEQFNSSGRKLIEILSHKISEKSKSSNNSIENDEESIGFYDVNKDLIE